jgi:uncharacterized protein YlxW (UPF0749 family)
MSHGPEHHLEEAQHVPHLAHDPFDRRVAMTMAIVAACLACVTMVSHRAHNDTLAYQTQADIRHTLASNEWSHYQAKKNRQYLYEGLADLAEIGAAPATNDTSGKRAERLEKWRSRAGGYVKDTNELEQKANELTKEAEDLQTKSEHAHHQADRFDFGELGVELALVLCSIAVLTKQRGFWFAGIGFGVLGAVVAATGYLA